MQTITFTCETITPMFLAGADGTTPELRAPSIKGALRFWWRAMNGHLPLEDRKDNNGKVIEKGMRTIEGEIFGDTSQRSKMIIQVIEPLVKTNEEFLLPHKAGGAKPRAFSVSEKCKIKFSLVKTDKCSIEQLKSLFILTFLLGGFGKRSRRGMGSMKIIETKLNSEASQLHTSPQTVQEIETMIRIVSTGFRYSVTSNYATIQSIEIGRNAKTTNQIGRATHEVKFNVDTSYNKIAYDSTLGAGRPRFASPVYVSILENGNPIITTLKTVSPNRREVNMNLQTELKNRIL